MPFTLYAPGTRVKHKKGKAYANRYFVAIIRAPGQQLEITCDTTDESAARAVALKAELALIDSDSAQAEAPADQVLTFADAVALYAAARDPTKEERRRLKKIVAAKIAGTPGTFGARDVTGICHADLVAVANALHKKHEASTKNRQVMRPAAAVLHYVAGSKKCDWLRVAMFKEKPATTRSVDVDDARTIINNVRAPAAKALKRGNRPATARELAHSAANVEKKRFFLLWIFRQGTRITHTLRVTWEGHIDLKRRTVLLPPFKGHDAVEKPLHDDIFEILANTPKAERHGPLFPWKSRHSIYKWLRPYCAALKIEFTPHMARHSLGKWLNEGGASLRSIMDALDHKDPESSVRYQSTDIEVQRATGRRLDKLVSKGKG